MAYVGLVKQTINGCSWIILLLHSFIVSLYICSPPRKEKNSKPPTGENVVPCKRIIRVNPNGGKQGGIPEKESTGIANTKGDLSWRQTELIPRCPQENSNEDPSWRQKELFLRHQRKRRGIPKKESPGIFTPKYNLRWLQKKINSEVPEGNFLRSVQFLRRSELAQKGNYSEVPAGEFCSSGTIPT